MKTKILLIDDEVAFCELCALWLSQAGYQVECAHNAASGLGSFTEAKRSNKGFDLVIHDLALPPSFRPEDSLENLAFYHDVPVLVLTAHHDRALALHAIELGAWDFISKPIDPDLLQLIIQRALEKNSLLVQIKNLENELYKSQEFSDLGLVGKSSTIQSIRELIHRIAATKVPVLIQGPSGTGKEIIANAIHNNSDRKEQAFISVHCGAIPAELLESELFGYKKGAFTGADSSRKGLLASADKGTLFLDEIGEMPLSMQVKLLRVLQEGSFYPVGSRQLETINFRLICATNRDLPKAVQSGIFREDLYYRLKGLTIITTSLASRKEDILVLVDHFLHKYNQYNKTTIKLDKDTCQWFINTPWPGNVRELKNTLESAAAICLQGTLSLQEVELIRGESVIKILAEDQQDKNQLHKTLEQQVSELEIKLIATAMKNYQGNKTHAAQALGITRQGLINKIKRYKLE
ncbi:MAG: sigma-54-dependent Fis family transcriptional regulator [Oleispira sp.]|nr:sigma-54-dependent Fis family transcriptional regulator [Oleispira sp.]